MSLNDLKPAKSTRARACCCATAVKAFECFLPLRALTWIMALIAVDPDRAGCILVAVMDKFGVYLAFHAGARWQPLSRHSAAQYFRQAKGWVLDE
ncbi:LOW QUALITY PROTEIN: hypothetical protein PHMEG_00024130 [Phytophthora megakarya]|uniref:Uncharacterized protein n=1 Tax=Phytophthora megakarya TaxID=4795 RepID=A0A225VF83_9STRA|nr:LOW QUALITY PROTEIN: hypothetical protein PHMEG_00024130 [Phytophthora megakarya]